MPLNCFKGSKKGTVVNPSLAAGWEEFWDPRYGASYFYNKKLKKTQWVHPGFSTDVGKKVAVKAESKPEPIKWNANSQTQQVKANPVDASNPDGEYKCYFGKGPTGLSLEEGLNADGHTCVRVMEVKGQALTNEVTIKSEIVRVGSTEVPTDATVKKVRQWLKESLKPVEVVFKPFKEETGSSKDQVVEEKPNDLVVEKTVVKDEATTAPKEEVVEKPKEEVVEKGKEKVEEKPKEEVVEKPKEKVVEKPKEEVVEKPKEEVVTPKKAEEPKQEETPKSDPPIEKSFEFKKNASLGLVLAEVHSADGKTDIVHVIEKVPNSQAAGFKSLLVYDQIARVGAQPVRGLDFKHVMDKIKEAKGTNLSEPLVLAFIAAVNNPIVQNSPPPKAPSIGDTKSQPTPIDTTTAAVKKAGGGKKAPKKSLTGTGGGGKKSGGKKKSTPRGSTPGGKKKSTPRGSTSGGKKKSTPRGSTSGGKKKSGGGMKKSGGGKKKS